MRDLSTHAGLEQLGEKVEPLPAPEQLRAMPRGQLFKLAFSGAAARNRRRQQLLAERAATQSPDPEP